MADEFKSNEVAMSHKGKKVSSYTLKYKYYLQGEKLQLPKKIRQN